MNAIKLLPTVLLLALTGCAAFDPNTREVSGDIDAELSSEIVALLLQEPGTPQELYAIDPFQARPGPSLVAGDLIALSWFVAHTNPTHNDRSGVFASGLADELTR